MTQEQKQWTMQLATVKFTFDKLGEEVRAGVDCQSAGYFESAKLNYETLDQFQQRCVQEAYQRLLSESIRFKRVAEEKAFILLKDGTGNGWLPISELDTKKKTIYGYPYLLFSKELIDEDFNPSGVVDGFYQDGPEEGWVGGVWNGHTDTYEVLSINPTHYKEKRGPVV